MKLLPTSLRIATIIAMTACTGAARAQNIVADPGFDASASFAPAWTLTEQPMPGPPDLSNVGTNPTFSRSPNNHANLTDDAGQTGTLTQLLTTSPGTAYTVSFWYANDKSSTGSFTASFGSFVFTPISAGVVTAGYTQAIMTNLIASGTSTLLSFSFRHDSDFWRLDDVSVSATPEGGSTLWLALPVFAGLCLVNLRRSRRGTSRS